VHGRSWLPKNGSRTAAISQPRAVKTVNENHGKALTLQQAAQAAITQDK
jgi:hypothetical protein